MRGLPDLLALALVVVAACSPGGREQGAGAPLPGAAPGREGREAQAAADPEAPAGPGFRFHEVAASAGLGYRGPTYSVAAADFDGDGWPDLAVSRHASLAVYRNREGRGFGEVMPAGGEVEGDLHGLAWLDLDGDGLLELFVSTGGRRGRGGRPNLLLENHRGRLEASAELPPVLADASGRGRCAVPADLDGDGTLDLLLLGAAAEEGDTRAAARGGEDGGFRDRARELGWAGIEAECAVVVPVGDGSVYALVGEGRHGGRLLRSGPGGRVVDVSAELGIVNDRPVFSVVPGDYDNDGDLDLYYVIGRGVPNEVTQQGGDLLYRMVHRGEAAPRWLRFQAEGELAVEILVGGLARPELVYMGRGRTHPGSLPWRGSAGDPALAGRPELAAGDRGVFLWREESGVLELLFAGGPGVLRSAAGRISGEGLELVETGISAPGELPARNRLYEYRDGRFVDVTLAAGVGDPSSGRDAVFADLDNDGDLDLYAVNGGPAFANQPDALYRNDGDGTFTDVTAEAGLAGPRTGRGCSALAFDPDGDGDLDLLATNGDGPPPGNRGPLTLWRNDTPGGNWVRLELVGGPGNPRAIGAVAIARFGDKRLALARTAATGRFATSLLPLHFGLGEAREAEIEVRWPGGGRSRLRVVAGRTVRLRPPS